MSDKPISDLRRRMIADMTIRTFSDKTRHDYIPHVEAFARFLRMRVHSSASARTGGLRPTLHSDWNVIAIGPLRIVENRSRGPCTMVLSSTFRKSGFRFPSENATA